MTTHITYRFRIKDSSCKAKLCRMAGAVNWVWNYANEVCTSAYDYNGRWLSAYDLHKLAKGACAELGLARYTVDMTLTEHALRRSMARRRKLAWRSRRRSLGWIPFKRDCYSMSGDVVRYGKHYFRIWKTREVVGKYKCGSFNQDTRGRWYVNIVCEVPLEHREPTGVRIGVDLGLKTTATFSDGCSIHQTPFAALEQKLGNAQRAGRKKQAANIHAKIRNRRKDHLHKATTVMVRKYDGIYVGNVSPSKLKKTRMAKSVSDQGWHMLKSMLATKAIRLGVDYKEVNEMFSTVTCSTCLQRTGPSGLSALGVREWTCPCGAHHQRDVNAARNILLRATTSTPTKGAAGAEGRIDQDRSSSKDALGDACGPRSAGVPSRDATGFAAPPIAIAPAHDPPCTICYVPCGDEHGGVRWLHDKQEDPQDPDAPCICPCHSLIQTT